MKKTKKFTFTDAALRKIEPPEKGRAFFTDQRQAGFRIMVTPTGTITFQCRAWSSEHDRPITRTLGKYPALTITKARKLCADTLAEIQSGKDLEKIRRDKAAEMTLDAVFERFLTNYAKVHKRSWKDDESRYRLYIRKPFGNRKLPEISTAQVRSWHRKLSTSVAPATANRALALLRRVYNVQAPEKSNPCVGVQQFREQSRERFLQPSELSKLFDAIQREQNDTMRDYILMSLYTGGRRANVMGMRWKDVSLDLELWRIPGDESKNAEPMIVPLVQEALEILQRRKASTASVFVFPGSGKSGHLQEPKKAWRRICKTAGLEGVRLHDLRRTLGSWQTMTGASTAIVGKTLGHKSVEATAVYARLNTDPVRASMKKAVAAMKEGAEQSGKKVVKIGGENA